LPSLYHIPGSCENPAFAPRTEGNVTAGDFRRTEFGWHQVDKQGPFVFEHQPVKTEGCVSCHVPHGSPNPHMMKQSNLNLLCLQCHTASSFSAAPGTPQFHSQAAQFQACIICHTAIHGSNFDRHFMK
jgi:predicted CXXCH cytochrome family protein